MLDDIPAEFPRVNENFLGRQTRYGYAGKMGQGSMPLFEGLIKYDHHNGKSQTHEFGRKRYGGEAVFVPRPSATSEDEGWLVTFVHDTNEDISELVVVNAQDVNAEPVARVLIPQRVPYGFHGAWVSEEQLRSSVLNKHRSLVQSRSHALRGNECPGGSASTNHVRSHNRDASA
jgi:carotenoid cleavage dioxygenase